MSESGDYDPGPWRGHDFGAARRDYTDHARTSFTAAVSSGRTNTDLIEPEITFNSSHPLAIISDVTGSMGTDPSVFFSKLGYLEIEGKEYLGPDMEIVFGATGDAYSDKYPVQIRKPAKGLKLKEKLKELIIEGGGGAQTMETYELIALYFARKVKTPKAIHKPILILIGDESPYDHVDKAHAKNLLGIEITGRLTTKQIFEELKEKWSVYLIRRTYGSNSGDTMDSTNRKIYNTWATLLGEDHICTLPSADRVVDIIFGILANETDRVDYFREEVTDRQMKDDDGEEKIATVFKSLETIHFMPTPNPTPKKSEPGVSVTRRSGTAKGKPSKRLI